MRFDIWRRVLDETPASERPHTRHVGPDGAPLYVNALIAEPSPYLRQHALNPVDWRPWGADALAEAAALDRPIFLSAGYATCHWCHVMEHESFDDPAIAAQLNAGFVPVKLDREQRPDIDAYYMLATQLQHRHGGWPNSVWCLPDGRPFHTGTYFRPAHFVQILGAITQGWQGDGRAEFQRFAQQLSDTIQTVSSRTAPPANLRGAPDLALDRLHESYNADQGGFSGATQFPQEGYILFLLDHWRRGGPDSARDMALHSLHAMAAGGLHDHVGGGFHRYAVDVDWRTPHFEKMLYNQALLLQCYSDAFTISAAPEFKRAAERLVTYVLRDMQAADGAFFAAEDADSQDDQGMREEGGFFAWSMTDLCAALGADADWVYQVLNLGSPPRIEAGAVPFLTPGAAVDFQRLDPLLQKMAAWRRAHRVAPARDEKIIAGWNGLMIRALAEAGATFERPDWTDAAARALNAVIMRLGPAENLRRFAMAGRAYEQANLSDYVWLGQAALALASTLAPDQGQRHGWIALAEILCDQMLQRFAVAGGRLALFNAGPPMGAILEMDDGATPSGESSALAFLAQMQDWRPDPARLARAQALRDAISATLAEMPVARLAGLMAARHLQHADCGARRVLAEGNVILARHGLRLFVHVADGWHVQGFTVNGTPGPLPSPAGLPVAHGTLNVTLQPCNDKLCQAPVVVEFRQ